MKNFFWTLILLAVVLNLSADRIKRCMDSGTTWRTTYAAQQITEAKARFYEQNSDNLNALDSFNQGTAEERCNILEDHGFISEKTALCVADPGAIGEEPIAHTVEEMKAVRSDAFGKLGTLLAQY